MKIEFTLGDPAGESSYLQLKKSLPNLTAEEMEAGAKESGIPPLCQANLEERLFILGLQIMIRELTNPGDTIASAIAKSTDLTLIHQFLSALSGEVYQKSQEWQDLRDKVTASGKAPTWLLDELEGIRKEMGEDAWACSVQSPIFLSGLEHALVVIAKVMEGDEEPMPPPPPGPQVLVDPALPEPEDETEETTEEKP